MEINKWDLRYLEMAKFISDWSKDPSTQTGAVIVRPNGSVCSVGFNGFPQKMPDSPELYANREEKYSRIIHCEMNAMNFSRDATHDGYTLYTWPFLSCDRCFVHMVAKGITRFVAPQGTEDQLTRWGAAFERVRGYAKETGVEIVEIPRNQLPFIDNPMTAVKAVEQIYVMFSCVSNPTVNRDIALSEIRKVLAQVDPNHPFTKDPE